MDLLWMILWVFLVCAEAEKETEVKVELGHNVTLNCSGDNSDTYWYMEINHSQFKGFIARSFSTETKNSPSYCSPDLKSKYSVVGNRLSITNITAGDWRFYFCGRKINGSIRFVDRFQLISDVPISPSSNSSKEYLYQKEFIVFGSFILNIFLLVINCFLCSLLCLMKKAKKKKTAVTRNDLRSEPSPVPNDNTEIQYDEIQSSSTVSPSNIYHLAQLPLSRPSVR